MKKLLIAIFVIVLMLLNVFFITACDFGNDETNGNGEDTAKEKTPVLVTDYALPENFAITVEIGDVAIFNPGASWFYKTAKIGNDWQIIEYNRDLEDKTKQAAHFFAYAADNNYKRYDYDYDGGGWVLNGDVNFEEMIAVSPNNFAFIYEKPAENNFTITETVTVYDVDPTSNEAFIDAVGYTYKEYFDVEIKVDADYLNVCLYKSKMDGSTQITSNRAYEYTTSTDGWDSAYMSYRNYKSSPQP